MPSTTIKVRQPGKAWQRDTNYSVVPLNVKSNCDVQLNVFEGIGQWLVDNGIPASGIWAQTYESGPLIFAPYLQIYGSSNKAPNQDSWDYIGRTAGQRYQPLPEGPGRGGKVTISYDYGNKATKPVSPAGTTGTPYNGDLTLYALVALEASTGVVDGKGWWSLPAGTTGTPQDLGHDQRAVTQPTPRLAGGGTALGRRPLPANDVPTSSGNRAGICTQQAED